MAQPLQQFRVSALGSGNREVDARQARNRLNLLISTWPRMNETLDSQARRELADAYTRRRLGRPPQLAMTRFVETVKNRFRTNAEREIDSGEFQWWQRNATAQTVSALPELARVYANTVQLVNLGGGDEETRGMVADIAFPRPPATRDTGGGNGGGGTTTPGRSLAEAIAEATSGRVLDTYREPVIVEVEDDAGGVEVLPPVAPCELDAWNIDLRAWYWLTKMYQSGSWG